MKNVTISGKVMEMSEGRVLQFLPHDVLDGIKAADPHPYFAEFIVGHEGISHGATILEGIARKIKKLWSRDTVAKLASKIRGTSLSMGRHGEKDRKAIGRVVHGFACDGPGGQSEAHGITYIADSEARKRIAGGEINSCSIEADVELTADRDGYHVDGILDVPWLVLFGRGDGSPGFPGASILATVQMMETEEVHEMEITREDVLAGITKFGLKPGEVFSAGQLEADDKVKGLVRETTAKAVIEEKAKTSSEMEKVKVDLDTSKKRVADLEAESFQLKIRDEAKPEISKYLKGKNLSAAAAAAIEGQVIEDLSGRKVEKDKLAETVKMICDKKLSLIEAASGIKIETTDQGNGADKTKGVTIPAPVDKSKELWDPKNNPFIPVD